MSGGSNDISIYSNDTLSPDKGSSSPVFSPIKPSDQTIFGDNDLFDFDLDITEDEMEILMSEKASQESKTPTINPDDVTDMDSLPSSRKDTRAKVASKKKGSFLEEMYRNKNDNNVVHEIEKQYVHIPNKKTKLSLANKIDNLLEQSFHVKMRSPLKTKSSTDMGASTAVDINVEDMISIDEDSCSSLPNGQIIQEPPEALPSL